MLTAQYSKLYILAYSISDSLKETYDVINNCSLNFGSKLKDYLCSGPLLLERKDTTGHPMFVFN